MPAVRRRAVFEPIPPDFDIATLVENTENFQYVNRISFNSIKDQGIESFEKLVLGYVINGGNPLVIDGFDEILDPWIFTPGWLAANCGDKVENARDITKQEDLPLTTGHYLKNMGLLTNQYFERKENYKDKNRQRIYLKDIDCPKVWQEKLKELIPGGLFYLNDTVGEIGGPGAVDEGTSATGRRKGRGIARAGDLMSSLPEEMRAENLMCYIGHEGTYTPAHKEMCASMGQNIMVNASGTVGEDGTPEKEGSSIWFMTATQDRHIVAQYWLSTLGHDIEVEKHFAQLAAWKRAPFTTYVLEQRPGDFLLIPPLAPHQVWNRGTRTIKVAWNRTTVETLEKAFEEALPNARMVCRDEQYKNKAIVYYTLLKYSNLLRQAKLQSETSVEQANILKKSVKVKQLKKDFKRLFQLYKNILLSETFSPDLPEELPEYMQFESFVTCAYCRGNIFNRFLTCNSCVYGLGTPAEEPYDICMDCYVMGRSCYCISDLKWVEQWRWKDLVRSYEDWRKQVIEIENGRLTEMTPLPLQEERRSLGKKTIAQICQEQLKLRPWVDHNNPHARDEDEKSDEEIVVNDDGTVRRTTKKLSKVQLAKTASCHVCIKRHPKWKMAKCTGCDLWYCYGSLFRAHDLMPQSIMENPRWQCPHCQKVCNTGACRRDPRQRPFEPKGTLLGHDTKKVADARSTEALVDFSVSNLNWIREEDEVKMRRRMAEAQREKLNDQSQLENDDDEDPDESTQVVYTTAVDESFWDPALRSGPSDNHASPDSSEMIDDARSIANDSPLFVPREDPDEIFNEAQTIQWQNEYTGMENGSQTFSRKRQYEDADPTKLTARQKTNKRDKKERSAVNDATKQYLKQEEKVKLEQARKEGRFIRLLGTMKEKKQTVALRLPSDKLAEFSHREMDKRRQRSRPLGSGDVAAPTVAILQSDVADKKKQLASANSTKPKNQNKYRAALDQDDGFASLHRTKSANRNARYEGINPGSGDKKDEEDEEEHVAPRQRNQRARDQGDDELFELLDNRRESTQRQRTVGEQPNGAQIRTGGSMPARASTVNMAVTITNDEEQGPGGDSDDAYPRKPQLVARVAPIAPIFRPQAQAKPVETKETEKQSVGSLAQVAMQKNRLEEEQKGPAEERERQAKKNLGAEMAAAGLTDGDSHSAMEPASSSKATRVSSDPLASLRKRIKGISASNGQGSSSTSSLSSSKTPSRLPNAKTSTISSPDPSSGFTAINKPASILKTTVQLSAPVKARTTARASPPGRRL